MGVAQLVERRVVVADAAGSSPVTHPKVGPAPRLQAYPEDMSSGATSSEVRAKIAVHRDDLQESLNRHAATNPRLFGSVARGDATAESDIDIIVDLLPGGANPLMRLAGLSEEFRLILGRDVDVVAVDLLKAPVAKTALEHAVAI